MMNFTYVVDNTVENDTIQQMPDINTLLFKIIGNQAELLKHVLDVKKGLQTLAKNFENFKKSASQQTSTMTSEQTVPQLWKFTSIGSEEDLVKFEDQIKSDDVFKNECLIGFKKEIGAGFGKTPYDCVLVLSRKVFADEFWKTTAWTGGRGRKNKKQETDNGTENTVAPTEESSEGGPSSSVASSVNAQETVGDAANVPEMETNTNQSEAEANPKRKFSFSVHKICIDFLKQLVFFISGAVLTDSDMQTCVQCRTRNASQLKTSNRLSIGRTKKNKMYFYSNDNDD